MINITIVVVGVIVIIIIIIININIIIIIIITVMLSQVSSILLLILLHDALLIFGGFSLANNFFTLDLEGGLIVKKKSLQLVPSGGTATVGSGKLNQSKTTHYITSCMPAA